MEAYQNHELIYWDIEANITESHELIGEEPLSIIIDDTPYSVLLRTPGDERAHVAGFCLTDGIVENPEEIVSIAFGGEGDSVTNMVTVRLKQSRREQLASRGNLLRRPDASLCGKDIVETLSREIGPVTDHNLIDGRYALKRLEMLTEHQPLRDRTRASHAAAVYSGDFELLSAAEDVGRHNALDKAVGKILLDGEWQRVYVLTMSSRLSYELVVKAARARIPVLLSVSRPTSLAVQLANRMNMTLACLSKNGGLYIFCGEHRLKR